jgi:hypothetical protein
MSDVKTEVERLAELTWKAKLERIVRGFGEERNRVIHRVTLNGNARGFLPALSTAARKESPRGAWWL